ncbi:MAG: hypothetical protein OXI37_09120 [Gammaproteobacteria bacterium]|nr:hypothetical protein [Gammaproteobacteria bacterium]
MTGNLLTIPNGIGENILKRGGLIAKPLLGTDKFCKYCRECGLEIDRARLLRLERLKIFAPIFRVQMPDRDETKLLLPLDESDEWFKSGRAWDTSGMDLDYEVPDDSNRDLEAYYSAFQIDHLDTILSSMTISMQTDRFLCRSEKEPFDWVKSGEQCLNGAQNRVQSLQSHQCRPAIALLCQFISDRYYPQARTNQRTIKIPLAPIFGFDRWTQIEIPDWDWYEVVRNWDAKEVSALFSLTPEKLRHAYQSLAVAQQSCDPLENWYQLIQFVSANERDRLKGNALRAELIRSGAFMLRFLYQDLYDEELPHPNEITRQIITHFPELEVRHDKRRYLEFVVNRYELNPRPKLSLLVEGPSEEIVVRLIFDRYFGADPGTFGIEIIVLGGVDSATGGKADRFRAILRLVDYLHHHQTITFLFLDNENYARRLKEHACKAKSIHHEKRYVTRPEYIRIWKHCFELDNFSATEIARAFEELCSNRVRFTRNDVATCKRKPRPGAALSALYEGKTQYGLEKIKLAEILVQNMLSPSTRRKHENRRIIRVLGKICTLAARNPFPTMHELWEKNQSSKFLGKKTQQ